MTLTKRKRLYLESANPVPGDIVTYGTPRQTKRAMVIGFETERLEKLVVMTCDGRIGSLSLNNVTSRNWDDEDCDV